MLQHVALGNSAERSPRTRPRQTDTIELHAISNTRKCLILSELRALYIYSLIGR
jgi:hypothetical protein